MEKVKVEEKESKANNKSVRTIYEKAEKTSPVEELRELIEPPSTEDIKKDEGAIEKPNLPTSVPLNRLHGYQAELAALKIEEAENRVKHAQSDLKQAQKDYREAKISAQEAADQILAEMNVHPACIINVDNKQVLPPKGQNFVMGRNE